MESIKICLDFSDEKVEQVAIEKTKRLAKRLATEPEATTTMLLQDEERDDEKWDCESVLSTYSNIYNHPKLIAQLPRKQIRLSKKTGLPLADNHKTTKEPTTEEQEDDDDDDDADSTSQTAIFERKKGETSEERRARKQAVKEIRRVIFNSFRSILRVVFDSGSTNCEESDENCFQTRRTETTARTSFAFHSSTFAKSSCYLNFFFSCFFRCLDLRKNSFKPLIVFLDLLKTIYLSSKG